MILALSGFPLILVSIIALIFIIGLIVVLHELGHFLVARKSKIKCYEFSIGMGPAIYKKQGKETLFCLRAIPIGGYVSMAGEIQIESLIKKDDKIGYDLDGNNISKISLNENVYTPYNGKVVDYDFKGENDNPLYLNLISEDGTFSSYNLMPNTKVYLSKNSSVEIVPYKDTFDSKSLLKRFLTLFAGPFMNFVLAILLYFIYFCCIGVPNLDSNVIGSVNYGYSAYNVLKPGDTILAIEGKEVSSWEEFQVELDEYNASYPTDVNLTILRDDEELEVNLPYSIVINSIGLSNLETNDYTYPEGLEYGAIVGNVALRYKNDNDDLLYPLSSGDVITKMLVKPYLDSDIILDGTLYEINSFSDIVNVLKDVDVADIYFEYYSLEKAKVDENPYVSIEESSPLVSWSNETLDNQRIEKIAIYMGVSPVYHFSLGGVLKETFTSFWSDFTLIFRTLKLLIAPSGIRQVGVSDLSSVVGIFGMIEDIIVGGFLPLIAFTAMLSINIGIVNLLPIPALDGGRIVFLGYELITRRKPNKKFELILNNVFFILLMILFIYVTFNDVMRLTFILGGGKFL